jgi:GNAT superfamily N-acetyltransferase
MQIVDYHDKLLPSLTRLINQQIVGLPPCCVMTQEQVADAIAQGGILWNLHYPGERVQAGGTICVLEHRVVVAAAQWHVPRSDRTRFVLQWIVANPERPVPLRTLLHLIDKAFEASGCGKILCARFSFGIGWPGIPAAWTHVIEAMQESGYRQAEPWVLMHGETAFYASLPPAPKDGLRFYWNMNKPALEWNLAADLGGEQVGECHVWGIPPHLEDWLEAPLWASIEYVEVAESRRRNGLGKRLLAEQMRFHARRGVQQFIAWTREDNIPARRLNESMGFAYGPDLVVMEKIAAPVSTPQESSDEAAES